jgi:hypothetical protein
MAPKVAGARFAIGTKGAISAMMPAKGRSQSARAILRRHVEKEAMRPVILSSCGLQEDRWQARFSLC